MGGGEDLPFMAWMYRNRFAWRHQLKEFRQAYKAVAVDLRGYGFSDAPVGSEHYQRDCLLEDIRGVIEALGTDEKKNGEWELWCW